MCTIVLEELEQDKQMYEVTIKINRIETYENKTYLYFKVKDASCKNGFLLKTMQGVIKIKREEYEKLLLSFHDETLLYRQCIINGQFEKSKNQSNPGQINPLIQQLSYRYIGTFQGDFAKEQSASNELTKKMIFRNLSLELFRTREFIIHIILQRVTQLYTQPTLGIVIAMLLGSRENVTSDIISLYKEQGIIHIIAISGLHIGFLYIALEFCCKLCKMPKKIRLWSCGCILIIYNYILGFNISALRASWMVFVYYAAIAYEKPYSNKVNLFTVGTIFIFLYPQSLFHCGFLLSYGAVIGLFYIQPRMKYMGINFRHKYHFSKYNTIFIQQVFNLISVSIAVNIMTLPIILYYFGGISMTSIFANVFVVPIILLFYFLILTSALLGSTVILLSKLVSGLVVIIDYYIVFVCKLLDLVPMNYILLRRPNFLEIVLYYVFVVLCMHYLTMKGVQADENLH